jgi:hypothetical protein
LTEASVPEEIRRLADQREAARRERDFGRADALREEIHRAGFDVTDTPSGPVVVPKVEEASRGGEPSVLRSQEVPSLLDEPAGADATVQWIVEGWPEDARRGIESFDRHCPAHRLRHVLVDLLPDESLTWPQGVDVVRLRRDTGWAAARNAGLGRSTGAIAVVADGSIEATGDVIGPLIAALEDHTVGITGPFGIVTHDLHQFHESPGPDVDAVEGYLMAFRRDLVQSGLRFDEKFRFYRTADIELSFQVKARGLRATVTSVPVRRHEHRMWANTREAERDKLSKRNFYRFLDRWRGRTDLLVEPHTHEHEET